MNSALDNRMKGVRSRLCAYGTLVKSLQTALLVITGLAGYMSARCPVTSWETLLAVSGSLFLAIGGTTVLNMVWDRDIDCRMTRTCLRPLPRNTVSVRETLTLGLVLIALGLGWSYALSPLYAAVVLAGVLLDALVYTIWLKRRSSWSIIWGGLAGGMPVLAGRVLGTGQIDLVGILLALAILLWIPTHIVTLSIRYADDYYRAGVPVIPNIYGIRTARLIVAGSTVLAAAIMLTAVWGMGLRWMHAAAAISAILLILALVTIHKSTPRLNLALYKSASLYMLASMAIVIFGA